MQQELYIDNEKVELYDKSITQNFQVNEFSDLQDRRGDYTNTIKIPRTSNNIRIFGLIGLSGSDSRVPYKKLKVKYVVDGIELISNGYAKIISSLDDIEIVIYSGNISLKESIGIKKLNELNYSDVNHFLNQNTYISSFTNTSGFIYALGSFGIYPPTSDVNTISQAPSIFLSTLFNKILTEAGFTYSGDIFQEEGFRQEVMPISKGYNRTESTQSNFLLGNLNIFGTLINDTTVSQTDYVRTLSFGNNGNITGMVVTDSNKLRIASSGIFQINYLINYNISNGSGFIYVYKNGEIIDVKAIEGVGVLNETLNIVVSANDIISFEFLGQNVMTDPFIPIYKFNGSLSGSFNVNKVSGGLRIDFSTLMSDITQESLIKDVMKRYGLVYKVVNKHCYFRKLETILNDREGAEDWSSKFVYNVTESYEFGNFGKANMFKYRYREADEIDGKYDAPIVVDNEHYNDTVDLVTSIFEMSPNIYNRGNEPLYDVPVWKFKGVEVIENPQKPRLFKVKKKFLRINYSFPGSNDATFTGIVPFLSLDNVEMKFYIQRNYLAYSRIMNTPKAKTMTLNLSLLDICNLDFFKLKYNEQLGQYYYLNKIISYKPGKLVQCEFIQVVGMLKQEDIVNKPPTTLGIREITIENGGQYTLQMSDFIDTVPPYYDQEFDLPEKVRITSVGSPNTKIYKNGVMYSNPAYPLDVNSANMNLVIKDNGLNTNERLTSFGFRIQSYNNPNFSSVSGAIYVRIRERKNLAPVADAGVGETFTFGSNNYTKIIYPYGCDSYDPDGVDITYLWSVVNPTSGVVLSDATQCNPTLTVSKNNAPITMTIQLKLTVTDVGGLTDVDYVDYTFTSLSNTN